ncbi:MAG TPA: hypothetical protein VF116_22685 [Ktedonobacterales bacterium]
MTTEQARALGILSGLQGQPAVWRHTAAAYPAYLVAWQQGHSEAVKARAAEQQARAKAQARQQGMVSVAGGDLFGATAGTTAGVPPRVWGRCRVVPLPVEEADQLIAHTLAEAGRIADRLDIALQKAHVREQELRRGRDYSHGGRGG